MNRVFVQMSITSYLRTFKRTFSQFSLGSPGSLGSLGSLGSAGWDHIIFSEPRKQMFMNKELVQYLDGDSLLKFSQHINQHNEKSRFGWLEINHIDKKQRKKILKETINDCLKTDNIWAIVQILIVTSGHDNDGENGNDIEELIDRSISGEQFESIIRQLVIEREDAEKEKNILKIKKINKIINSLITRYCTK